MSRPILNIVDEKVVLTLTVQDAAAAAAKASEVQTGLDRIATGEDVTAAEAAAAAAEVAKIEWQGDWVAGTYQIHDAVAYLGSSWIANKTTSEVPSLAAVDWDLMAERGTDGDTLPVGAENDLLQANGAGVFEAKSPTLVLQPKVPFEKSPIGSKKITFAWDNFNRADGAVGVADSGQTWEVFGGVAPAGTISGNLLLPRNTRFFLDAPNNTALNVNFSSINIIGDVAMTNAIYGIDENNYISVGFSAARARIDKVVAGVRTFLGSGAVPGTQVGVVNQNTKTFMYNPGATLDKTFRIIFDNFSAANVVITTSDADVINIIDNMTKVGIEGMNSSNIFFVDCEFNNLIL